MAQSSAIVPPTSRTIRRSTPGSSARVSRSLRNRERRRSGRWIKPPAREPMATAEPPEREPAPPDEPVPEERQAGILGARRPEPTRPRQERREPTLVSGQERKGHLRGPTRACAHWPDQVAARRHALTQPPGRAMTQAGDRVDRVLARRVALGARQRSSGRGRPRAAAPRRPRTLPGPVRQPRPASGAGGWPPPAT